MEKCERLEITGEISVARVWWRPQPKSMRYLIMGPTGSGKSSFIEALAGPGAQELSISKDQLLGCTQDVIAYQLVNVYRKGYSQYPIYLIDTPGFCDSVIPEVEIMKMIRQWLTDNNMEYVNKIIYMTSIDETRLPGTKKRTLEMLHEFLNPSDGFSSVVFATSMWNRLHTERMRKRGEANFLQLRDECWKAFTHGGAITARFMNDRESALQILDQRFSYFPEFLEKDLISPHLYEDLRSRINDALLEKEMLESDLSLSVTQGDDQLRSIVLARLSDNKVALDRYIDQFLYFGDVPPGFQVSEHQQLLSRAIEASNCKGPVDTAITRSNPPVIPKFSFSTVVVLLLRLRKSKWFKPRSKASPRIAIGR